MDWPMFRQVERQATRLHDMMDRLDVSGIKIARLGNGDAYAEARTKCLNCINTRECLTWLDSGPLGTEAPEFCPNLALFKSCKET